MKTVEAEQVQLRPAAAPRNRGSFAASVVISTKNRRNDLRRAVQSSLAQLPHVEVIVIDDGSNDGTIDMLADEFPQVTATRSEVSHGYIVQRNRGAQMAAAPVVISIDDDAIFASPSTVAQTLQDFCHPRVGAVAIPYIDVCSGPTVKQRDPNTSKITLTSAFRGTASAFRRDIFLALGGFRASLVHQGEEDDYCLRLLEAGYVTRLGRADPIEHHESPQRDRQRIVFHQSRNHVLFCWQNVPGAAMPVHLAATVFNCLRTAHRRGLTGAAFRGCLTGLTELTCNRHRREPVAFGTYRLLRRIKKGGPVQLDDIDSLLGPSRLP